MHARVTGGIGSATTLTGRSTGKGRKQAKRLAKRLADLGATRPVSSPALRCVQTFEPAAKRLGLPLEQRDELAEGGGLES